MTWQQWQEYAERQIQDAEAILAQHWEAGGGCCSCGHDLPCTRVDAATAHRNHFAHQLHVARDHAARVETARLRNAGAPGGDWR